MFVTSFKTVSIFFQFLASLKLMDYSLLVGIHDCDRSDKYTDDWLDGDGNGCLDGSPGEDDVNRCEHNIGKQVFVTSREVIEIDY